MLRPGKNVYHLEKADRFALIIDGENYYQALVEAFEKAQRSIFIIGWDIDSRTRLKGTAGGAEFQLFYFLNSLTKKNSQLQVYLLCWNYSILYSLEREFWPIVKPAAWGPRIHFRLDYHHPWLSSHHQKMVLVDEQVAFIGGMDICENRWDTSLHAPHSLLRVNSSGVKYRPWHDAQVCVSGAIVQFLVQIGKERWRWATGQELPSSDQRPVLNDPWPESVFVELKEAMVGVARTLPNYRQQRRVREIYQLNKDLLRTANKYIYIENQYLTARPMKKILIRRLQEEVGPEIIIVLPKNPFGWLESRTIWAVQSEVLEILHEKDKYGRLTVLYPRVNHEGEDLYVHSKVLLIDDQYLKIGSSNMNNRSLGVDTECDLVLYGSTDDERKQIRYLRHRLWAEHLGVSTDWLDQNEGSFATLTELIKSQMHRERSLQPFPNIKHPWLLMWLKSNQPFFDRHRPITSLFFWIPELTGVRGILRFWYFVSRLIWAQKQK